jgi:TonB family protein
LSILAKINPGKSSFATVEEKKTIKPKRFSDEGRSISSSKDLSTQGLSLAQTRERDRRIAIDAGILGLLKDKGGGLSGRQMGTVAFGGLTTQNFEAQMPGQGSTSGLGGLGLLGSGPVGDSLGLGVLGSKGLRSGNSSYGSHSLRQRNRKELILIKEDPQVAGSLNKAVVGRYIRRYWTRFKYCYDRALENEPDLFGKITLRFRIDAEGRVNDIETLFNSTENSALEACIFRVMKQIRFPKITDGVDALVTYPFVFSSAG